MFASMTVGENIEIGLRLSPRERRQLVRQRLFDLFPILHERRMALAGSLSGGEQQRLAFARLLIQKPRWIFMDEATAALDEENQDAMMQLVLDELPGSALISIGHRPGLEAFHERTLHLQRGPEGAMLAMRAPGRVLKARRQIRIRNPFRRGTGKAKLA